MKNTQVVISGGGVGGLATAWWLSRAGARVTVLERASTYRPEGHYIALKSVGVQLLKTMGLYEAAASLAVRADDLRVIARDGAVLRETKVSGMQQALNGYLMFKRAELHQQLYDAVRDRVEVRFGTQLRAVHHEGDAVVLDCDAGPLRADLLVGADGIHSHTRELVFGDGFLRPLGGTYVAMNLSAAHGFDLGVMQMFIGTGQTATLIPGSAHELTVMISYGDGGLPLPKARDAQSMKAFLLTAYRDFPAELVRAFELLDDRSFVYTDTIARVVLPSLVRGRVALVGDAAHCPTFLSGMGSSLALQGAQALAASLTATPDDVPRALRVYERDIAPIARSYHRLARALRPLLLSRNQALAAARDAVIGHSPSWLLAGPAKRFHRLAKT